MDKRNIPVHGIGKLEKSQKAILLKMMILGAMSLLLCCSDLVPPAKTGLEGELALCPDSPNCVSSLETNPSKHVDPLSFSMAPEEAVALLVGVLKETKRVRIIAVGERYVHAEFTSRIFRFVDDAEFMIDADKPVLHMRSASRVGYYDFGANRRRLEALKRRLREAGFR